MSHMVKAKHSTWYVSGLGALMLLIGSARSAISQVVDEESSGSITPPLVDIRMGHSIPQSINVEGVTRTYRLYVPRTFKPDQSALII
jgi:poly(3-hydroxybutyrate) depolymerase